MDKKIKYITTWQHIIKGGASYTFSTHEHIRYKEYDVSHKNK